MTRKAAPRTIHYPLAAVVVRHLKRHGVPGDYRTVVQRLELDDSDPDDGRYYAVMVTGGWIALTFAVLIASLLIGLLVVQPLFSDDVDKIYISVAEALCFFCLAGGANAMARMLWYVPQARRRLQNQGPDSKAFKRSMSRTLPRNSSLIFQTAVAILVLVLAL